MVAYARSLCADVEFSPEDAGRSDPEFLYQVLDVAIKAGATTLNIPDTVGYTTPAEFGGLIARHPGERAGREGRDHLGALPRRPGAGDGQHAGGDPERRAAGRGDDQRHRRARRQHLAGRGRDGAAHAAARLRRCAPTSTPRRSSAPAAWSARTPASRSSRTRPSSAPTPSRTRRASTRTACSRTR